MYGGIGDGVVSVIIVTLWFRGGGVSDSVIGEKEVCMSVGVGVGVIEGEGERMGGRKREGWWD